MKSMLIALGLAAASITAAHSATLTQPASLNATSFSATSQGSLIQAKTSGTKSNKAKRGHASKKA